MIARRRFRWSLTGQLCILAVVFLSVPAILYKEFASADQAKAGLVLETVQDQGRTIASALAPYLTLKPNPDIALDEILSSLAGPRLAAKVLLRPTGAGSFYYIASSRSLDAAQMRIERDELIRQGVLSGLERACAADLPEVVRYRTATGPEALIASVVPVLNAAGCWAIVASFEDAALLGSSLGQSYWLTPEIRIAAAIYAVSAILVLAMFLRLWRNLRRFSAEATEIRRGGPGGTFAARNTVPELADVAGEFDRMVESLRKLSGAAEGSPTPIVITDAAGRIEYANPAFCSLTGYAADEVIGKSCNLLQTSGTSAETYETLWRTIARGEIWRGELCNRKKSGELYWALVSISCLHDGDGRIASYIGVQEDITERKRAERQRALMMAELNHRVKNSLATVKSIAAQMLRQTGSLETFKPSFEGRLQALSQAHDLLTRSNWEGADLATLVARGLEPFDRGSPSPIAIEGPAITMIPRAALVLGMTLHELSTNAAKYGALAVGTGRVSVAWRLERGAAGETLVVSWRERGGPLVQLPGRPGFGTGLIERGIAYELDGDVAVRYLPAGFECDIRIPWPINADTDSESGLAAAA